MTAPTGAPSGGSPVVLGLPVEAHAFTLFVTGQTARSQKAVVILRRICERLGAACELTIVDVLERPQLAEDAKILATPTLIRRLPLPARRLIGDFSDTHKLLQGLDLPPTLARLAEDSTA